MPAPLLIETIQQLVAQALEAARQEGLLQLETMPEIQVERPGNSDHGDFATNLPGPPASTRWNWPNCWPIVSPPAT